MLIGTAYLINKDLFQGRYVLKNSLSNYLPANYIGGYVNYINQFAKNKNIILEDISNVYPFRFTDYQDKDMTIILVIGESARADRQSLNGYKKDTNPRLSKEKKLISFPNVYSCGTLSRISINCLLSRKSQQDFALDIKETNLISGFNSLGFATYFFSTQTMYDTKTNYFYIAAKDAKDYRFISEIRKNIPSGKEIYDEYLIEVLKEVKSKEDSKKLIVLYLSGSHKPYSVRVPDSFRKFRPDELDKKGNDALEKMNNSYDNSIFYTDYVLSEIINLFRDENTFFYYVSDHGESLGENGKFYHGVPIEIAPREQVNVAQFIWASDSMIKLLGDKYKKLIAKKNNKLSQDNVFHSLFDCNFIKSKAVDKQTKPLQLIIKNLCNTNNTNDIKSFLSIISKL